MMTGVRFAGTPEEAPRAHFLNTPAATSELIAGWCRESGFFAPGWSLDSRSDEEVVCTRYHDSRTPNPDGGYSTVIIEEWVTFTLRPDADVGTCVLGSPEVKVASGGSGAGIAFGLRARRSMGSHTDLEGVLVKLGGSVAPTARTACGVAPG